MQEMAKWVMIAGVFLVLTGACLFVASKIPGMGKLPGDIFIKKDNFTFYFPLATCILLSIILSIVMQLLSKK